MTKWLTTMCFATMILIGLTSPSIQAEGRLQDKTLENINTVFVAVENLAAGAKTLSLSEEAIRTDVELQLRQAGIRVVTPEEGVKVPVSPFLYVQVMLSPGAEAAVVIVQVEQMAQIQLNGQLTAVITWKETTLLTKATAQGIRDKTKDLVDRFLNAWLSVNPKK